MHYRMQPFDGDWLAVDYGKGPRASANTESAPRYQALLRSGFGDLIEWLEENAEPDEGPPTGYSPTQVIKRLQDALIGVMRDAQRLGYAGRYQRLERIVKETHYIPAIARLTVRRYWDQLSTEQKRELVTTFGELSVANYASKFDGFSGERFQQLGEEKSGKSTIVRTQIVKSNGEAVPLDYTMREVKGRWRILNITADGVSDLSTKQAEYGSVMASGGFSALIARLEDQIRRYGG
jgi:phospholipid transport system substrate-binding protein